MENTLFEKLVDRPFNVGGIVAARRVWRPGDRYSYLERPRRSDGLLLLENTPATFTTQNGSRIDAEPGDILLLPKGAYYLLAFSGNEKGRAPATLLINFALSYEDGDPIRTGKEVLTLAHDDGRLLPLFVSASEFYKNGSDIPLKAKVFSVFDALMTLEDVSGSGQTKLFYKEGASVSDLARRSGVTEQTYRRLFREKTGSSPKQYMIRQKTEKARRMIESGDLGFAFISEYLGFYSLPYFYKVFKESTGMTPGEYREKAKTK